MSLSTDRPIIVTLHSILRATEDLLGALGATLWIISGERSPVIVKGRPQCVKGIEITAKKRKKSEIVRERKRAREKREE